MKTKLATLIAGLAACSLAAYAQTDASASSNETTTATTVTITTNTDVTTPAATPAPAAEAPAMPAAPSAETPAAPPAEPAAPAASAPAPAPAAPAAVAVQSPVIPVIIMDDVPLTDAIKNLARQAGLNYMLDPKVSFGQPDASGKIVGQPTVSIRWENITAEQALMALLNNYNLELVDAPRTHIARITTKDPAAPDPLITHIIQLKYAGASNVVPSVQTVLTDKRSKVIADVRTSQLVVLATEKEQNGVEELIRKLDTPTRQVLIEARLLETSMNPKTTKGLDWSGTLQSQHLAFGNNLGAAKGGGQPTPVTSGPKLLFDTAKGFNPATAFLDADGLSATLSFLNANSDAKVLSEPRTVVLDNDTADIEVGQNYPIVNVTAGTANTTGGSQITYSNLTVKLEVTPRISANNFINLKVRPKVLRLDSVQTFTVGGSPFDVPIFDTRILNTTVMIPSGNTLVMGGLVQDNQIQGTTKVPILGDLPGLGAAFRSKSKQRNKSNLIIFITPTVVDNDDYQPTETEYLKTPIPHLDNTQWSEWDSTKPVDWSKPVYDKENPPKHRDPVNPTY